MQGYVVDDPALFAELDLPPGEAIVRIPAALLPELMMGAQPYDH